MMAPPVFATCAASAAVTAALGSNPVRIFPFGRAPQEVAHPYCVWQIIGGAPENYMSGVPDLDFFSIQIDVYGPDGAAVRTAARAVRDAIEPVADVTAWHGETVDPQTRNCRVSFDARWGTPRDTIA